MVVSGMERTRRTDEGNFMLNFFSHPQLSKNPARAIPAPRPLGTLFVFLLVSSFPTKAFSQNQANTPRTFADWCLNKAKESVQTQQTIDVLLQEADTTDCDRASSLLSSRSELSLDNNQIADLKPLSSLKNLTQLSLGNNQIADLKPLSNLTNLTQLSNLCQLDKAGFPLPL
jgi:Leucine-rich repeat (LRR) protein